MGGMKKAEPVDRSACFFEVSWKLLTDQSSNGRDGLCCLALQVSSLVRVNQVALGSFVHDGGKCGACFSSGSFVARGDGNEGLLAKGLHAALFSAIALGPDDGLTGTLD